MSFWEILSVATWFCNNIVAQKEAEPVQEEHAVAPVVEDDQYSWHWWLCGGSAGTLMVLATAGYVFQDVLLRRLLQYAESRTLDVGSSRRAPAAESSKRSVRRRGSEATAEAAPHLRRRLVDRSNLVMTRKDAGTQGGRPTTEQEGFYEEFLRDLGQAMSRDVFDVSLVGTDGVPVGAIRSILAARSPVLKRMLYGDFSEASSESVCLGFHSTVLKALVEYCQSGNVQHVTAVFVSSSSPQEEEEEEETGKERESEEEKCQWKLDVPSAFSSCTDMISTWVGVIQAASYLEMDSLTRYVSAEVVRALHHDKYLACVVYGTTVRLGMVESLVREAALTVLRTCAPEQFLLQNKDVVATLDFAGLRDIVMDPFIPMGELTKFQCIELWSRTTADDVEEEDNNDDDDDGSERTAVRRQRKTRTQQAMEFLKTGAVQLERISAADLDNHVAPSGLVDTNTMLKAFKSRALYVEKSRNPSNGSSRGLFSLLGGEGGSAKTVDDEKETEASSTGASTGDDTKKCCMSQASAFERSRYAHVVGSSSDFVNGTYTVCSNDSSSSCTYTKVVTKDGYEWTLELSLQPKSIGMMATLLSWQQEDKKKKSTKDEHVWELIMKRPLFSPGSSTPTTRCTCCGGECKKTQSVKPNFLQHKLYRTQPQEDGGDARTQMWTSLISSAGTAPVVVWTDAKVEPCFGMVPPEDEEGEDD